MGREEVLMLLAVGDDCLKESLGLYNLRLYRGSINRSYYAIFNVVQALLQSKDILVKTHQGAHVQFYQHFIKTGIFNDEIKKIPQQVEDMRIKGDYEPDHQLYEEDAEKALKLAKQFYDAVKKYLDAEN